MGLKINAKKTVLLSKTDEWTDIGLELTIKGERIKRVEEVVYLGQTLAFQDRLERELTKRTSQVWKNFWSLKSIYKMKTPLSLKSKLLEMCTYPSLTYGAQGLGYYSKIT